MQDQITAAVLFLAKLIERSNINHSKVNSDQIELFKEKLSELLNARFENHWFPDSPFRGQGYRCIRLNKNMKKDFILESAAKACGMKYEDMKLPIELTIWVDPHEVCCRFGETKGSYCTLASFNDKENQEIHLSDEIFNKATYHYHNRKYYRNRKISDNSNSSSCDEKLNSPLKQKQLQSNITVTRRNNNLLNIKNQKLNSNTNNLNRNKMSPNNFITNNNNNNNMNQFNCHHNINNPPPSWFNMMQQQNGSGQQPQQQQQWMQQQSMTSTSPPHHGQQPPQQQYLRQQKWIQPTSTINYAHQNNTANYRNNHHFNKPTVKV